MSTLMVPSYMPIVNFVLALGLLFSRPQTDHLNTFIFGFILTDGRGTISDIQRATYERRHPSCMTRFLNESPWCPNRAKRRRIEFMRKRIQKARAKQGDRRPIVFLIIDDTQCLKDRSTSKIEGLDDHYSHSVGKSVWSHSVVTSHIVSDAHSFAYDFRSYFRQSYCEEHNLVFKSKVDLAMALVRDYESTSEDEQVYVLVDSWYPSKDFVDTCNQEGFQVIAAFPVNRKMYPQGIGIKVSEFASTYMQSSDLHSVTVDGHHYKYYPYEGKLGKIENVKVLLSWEDTFKPGQAPFSLLCTDSSLDFVTILRYYDVRWHIETGYRYFKDLLGFDNYQLLSMKGIERYWCIQFLTNNFLEHQRHEWRSEGCETIGDVVRRIRKENMGQIVAYAYEQALSNKPLKDVLKSLNLTA